MAVTHKLLYAIDMFKSFKSLINFVIGKKTIDSATLEEIETLLLTADVGIATCEKIINNLTKQLKRKQLDDPKALLASLQQQLIDLLSPVATTLKINQQHQPFVILLAGINGAGKTTTIGKLAKQFTSQGKTVLLAAGDTFRAAAIDQLKVWGQRNKIQVVSQLPGADSAAVIFDAINSAKAKNIDIVLADTAGRLHTQQNLMQELAKIVKVIKKIDDSAPHETILVIDATTGQNALNQVKQFNKTINLTGIILTKLDGTAKGGIIFTIANELKLPIRYIGIGEKIEDLKPFNATDFVAGLFSEAQDVRTT